jgi:hypothetical protein
MAYYLISELSATGKTALGDTLATRDYEVIDVDELRQVLPEQPSRNIGTDMSSFNRGANGTHMSPSKNSLFVCGNAENANKFLFILHLPGEELRDYLQQRADVQAILKEIS